MIRFNRCNIFYRYFITMVTTQIRMKDNMPKGMCYQSVDTVVVTLQNLKNRPGCASAVNNA